jgi:hypothetical protein
MSRIDFGVKCCHLDICQPQRVKRMIPKEATRGRMKYLRISQYTVYIYMGKLLASGECVTMVTSAHTLLVLQQVSKRNPCAFINSVIHRIWR